MNIQMKLRFQIFAVMFLANSLNLVLANVASDFNPNENIEKRLIYFEPSIQLLKSDNLSIDESTCIGFAYTSNLVALPMPCIEKALELMIHNAVSVFDLEGELLGVLSGYSEDAFSSVFHVIKQSLQADQTLLLPFTLSNEPYDSPQMDDSKMFLKHLPPLTRVNAESIADEGKQYLFTTDKITNQTHWQMVQLNVVTDSERFYFLVTPSVESVALGSPVVNEHGQVLCLMAGYGKCQGQMSNKVLTGTDSCQYQLPYMQCSDIKWDGCTKNIAEGTCKNIDGEICLLFTTPDGLTLPGPGGTQLRCKNAEGCGGVECPAAAATNKSINADCQGLWGFCEARFKAIMQPPGCLAGHMDIGDVDCHCDNSCPKGAGFYGLVIGVSASAVILTTVTILAIVAGIYKFRKRGYQSIEN